jgi:hypothetical protein
MSQDPYFDLPDLDEGETEELPGGDTPEETENAPSLFREITEDEMEEGRKFGEEIDPEDDESGTDPEEE